MQIMISRMRQNQYCSMHAALRSKGSGRGDEEKSVEQKLRRAAPGLRRRRSWGATPTGWAGRLHPRGLRGPCRLSGCGSSARSGPPWTPWCSSSQVASEIPVWGGSGARMRRKWSKDDFEEEQSAGRKKKTSQRRKRSRGRPPEDDTAALWIPRARGNLFVCLASQNPGASICLLEVREVCEL